VSQPLGPSPGQLPGQSPGTSLPPGHDGVILDLDGVVYRGRLAVPGAAAAVARLAESGVPVAYATNNAARPAAAVAAHLCELGIPTDPEQVVTSAQVAVEVVAARIPAGASVLVVGGPGLRQAVAEAGFVVVDAADDLPAAVVQGFGPDTSWRHLAEATYAVSAGASWVATNTDLTFPTERGQGPGNGTFVSAVAAASGRTPLVAGKPNPPLLLAAARRLGARSPLVVGDRLDTDVAGARAAGLSSVLVLSGVTAQSEVGVGGDRLLGPVRPTFVADDLLALVEGRWLALDPPLQQPGPGER
jgi:glycerol-1-phosphatase